MWAKILGGILIASGLLFLLNPERLRRRLQKKTLRKLRRYVFAAALCLGAMLVSLAFKYEGLAAKIAAGVGVVLMFKGLYFLKAKSAELLVDWLVKLPVVYYRVFAGCQILAGALIYWGMNRGGV